MTPEQAEEVFFSAYRDEYSKQALNWSRPVVQREVNLKAYQSLIDAINQENDLKYATQYLSQAS
jgi:hypothetical protein